MSWIGEFLTVCKSGDCPALQCVLSLHETDPPCDQRLLSQYYYVGLKWAAYMGHYEVVKCLLQETGSKILRNVHYFGSETALMAAAKQGHVDIVEILLEFGYEKISCTGRHGLSALCLAARGGHFETVNLLLRNGARTSISNALVVAASNGQTRMVDMLIQVGANIENVFHSATALMIAVRNGHIATAESLLSHGASLLTIVKGETVMRAAVRSDRPAAMLAMLAKDYAADLEELDITTGESLLMFATRCGYVEAAKALVELGAGEAAKRPDASLSIVSPTLKNKRLNGVKWSFLHALRANNEDLVQNLVENGVDVNTLDSYGNTALILATKHRCINYNIVKHLVVRGANLEATCNETGATPLLLAVQNGSAEVVRFLICCGANKRALHSRRYTALMLASGLGYDEIVEILMENGEETPNIEDRNQALLFAAYNGHAQVVRLLLDHGADIEAKSHRKGSTPLILATMRGHIETVKLLLQLGADSGALNYDGFNPAKCALVKRNSFLFSYLSNTLVNGKA